MNFLYLAALFYFLVQKPFVIYLLNANLYRAGIAVIAVLIGLDFFMRATRGAPRLQLRSRGLPPYSVFLGGTLLAIILGALRYSGFDPSATSRFMLALLQFYLIYQLLIAHGDHGAVLDKIFKFSVVLAALAVGLFCLQVSGIQPPTIMVDLSLVGEYPYYIPFGFGFYDGVSSPINQYRAYSYFLEPAKFASFLCPFIFYGIGAILRRATLSMIGAVSVLILALGLTVSVAGYLAFAATGAIYLAAHAVRQRKFGWILVAGFILFGGFQFYRQIQQRSAHEWVTRRGGSLDGRMAQFHYATQYMKENIVGKGMRDDQSELRFSYYNRAHGTVIGGGTTSILLLYLQSFGLISLFPMAVLLWAVLSPISKCLFGNATLKQRTFAAMVLANLLFAVSIDPLFTPLFMILLCAFYLELDNRPKSAPAKAEKPILALAA